MIGPPPPHQSSSSTVSLLHLTFHVDFLVVQQQRDDLLRFERVRLEVAAADDHSLDLCRHRQRIQSIRDHKGLHHGIAIETYLALFARPLQNALLDGPLAD